MSRQAPNVPPFMQGPNNLSSTAKKVSTLPQKKKSEDQPSFPKIQKPNINLVSPKTKIPKINALSPKPKNPNTNHLSQKRKNINDNDQPIHLKVVKAKDQLVFDKDNELSKNVTPKNREAMFRKRISGLRKKIKMAIEAQDFLEAHRLKEKAKGLEEELNKIKKPIDLTMIQESVGGKKHKNITKSKLALSSNVASVTEKVNDKTEVTNSSQTVSKSSKCEESSGSDEDYFDTDMLSSASKVSKNWEKLSSGPNMSSIRDAIGRMPYKNNNESFKIKSSRALIIDKEKQVSVQKRNYEKDVNLNVDAAQPMIKRQKLGDRVCVDKLLKTPGRKNLSDSLLNNYKEAKIKAATIDSRFTFTQVLALHI